MGSSLLFGGAKSKSDGKEIEVETSRMMPWPKELCSSGLNKFELKSLELTPGKKMKHQTSKGSPSVSSDVLTELLGDAKKGEGNNSDLVMQLRRKGFDDQSIQKAVNSVHCLSEATRLMFAAKGFARPMMQMASVSDRIHPRWAFETASGRLACRQPNLQNLRRSSGDRYKMREAFTPKGGCSFITADYMQLELCILAHMSG